MAHSIYKPKPSQALVDALNHARAEMVELNKLHDYSVGICGRLPENRAGWRLREYISHSLGSYAFVEHWLTRVHGIARNEITDERLKKYRLAWIDQMIKDFTP